ncbi:MAG: GFA family protein [Halioglobus sp.]|nr:GFA family protein [Halioglobus sp.]
MTATSGGCLCGKVRFTVSEFSSGIFKCHCSKCRKAFGGASSAAALVPDNAFAWLAGAASVREYRASPGFLRRFCPDCGSILPQHVPDYGAWWIPAGLLDTDPGIPLKHHIHVGSKAAWEVLDEHTPQLPEGF